MISNALWLRKRAQNLLSLNSGIPVAHHFHPFASTVTITRQRPLPPPRASTESHVLAQFIKYVFFFFFFLSTQRDNHQLQHSSPSASTTCPHPRPSAFITHHAHSCPQVHSPHPRTPPCPALQNYWCQFGAFRCVPFCL